MIDVYNTGNRTAIDVDGFVSEFPRRKLALITNTDGSISIYYFGKLIVSRKYTDFVQAGLNLTQTISNLTSIIYG